MINCSLITGNVQAKLKIARVTFIFKNLLFISNDSYDNVAKSYYSAVWE